jgi:hypothetical protein
VAEKEIPSSEYGFHENTGVQIPVPQVEPEFHSGDQEKGIRPNRWEKFTSMVTDTAMSGPVGNVFGDDGGFIDRWMTERLLVRDGVARKQTKLTPEEANRLYPGMPEPFSEPVYPEVAALRAAHNKRKRHLEEWIGRGPESGLGLSLAAGAASGLLDPLSVAVDVGTGFATKGLQAGKALKLLAAENLATSAAFEVPSYLQAKWEGQNPQLGESAINVAAGTLLGTALGFAAYGVGKRLDNPKALATAIAQHEAGKKIDVTAHAEVDAARARGDLANGATPNPREEGKLYAAVDPETGEAVNLGESIPGTVLTDSPEVANNAAVRNGKAGTIQEVRVKPEARYLDIDQPASSPEVQAFIEAFRERTGTTLEVEEGMTLRGFMESMENELGDPASIGEAHVEFRQVAEELGYDGYTISRGRSKSVLQFDEKKLEPGEAMDANPDVAPTETPEQLEAIKRGLTDPNKSPEASGELDQELDELAAAPQPDIKVQDPEVAAVATEALAMLKKAADEDPTLLDDPDFKELQKQAARGLQESNAMAAYAECVTKELV